MTRPYVRWRCPPQCSSYRIVTWWAQDASVLLHKCLDCGRQGTTPVTVEDREVVLASTAWQEVEEAK